MAINIGRPERQETKDLIIRILQEENHPKPIMTIKKIQQTMKQKHNFTVCYNTVKKYIQQLVLKGMVECRTYTKARNGAQFNVYKIKG